MSLLHLGTLLLIAALAGCADNAQVTPQDRSDDDPSTSDDDPSDDSEAPAKDAGTRRDGGTTTKADAAGEQDEDPPAPGRDASTPRDAATATAPSAMIPAGPHTVASFASLAPQLGDALDMAGTKLTPAPPSGWVWYEIAGSLCRDGSPTGFYLHYASSDSLLFYLEGGGACTSPDFCAYNPKNVNEKLSGDGQTLLGSVGGATAGRQQPGTDGIFALSNSANPFGKWNMVYVPYCTGDVHFGTRKDVVVPNVDGKQQFMGYRNMEKFMARIVPTFRDTVKRVVLTGASAGGFGTMLNFSLVQDSFGDDTWVTAINDSGPSFPDANLPVCMQQRWRKLWGFAEAFSKDCSECAQADGGGLINVAKFYQRKHPNFRVAVVSSVHDEVIRAFYAPGLDNCSGFESGSPVPAVLISFPADQYQAGLVGLRSLYQPGGAFASYYINGFLNNSYHQHIWRPRFYEAAQGNVTIAQWATDFLAGKMTQVGP